jgi:hypothetical protein
MQKTLPLLLVLFFIACKNEEKPPEKSGFISVKSLIEDQVAHVDTSLYSIIRVTTLDSNRFDTVYIPRERFRQEAKDFLAIPDLADPKVAARYREEPAQYDEMLNRVIITYKPVDLEKDEYKKQELLVTPASATGDKVNNILISREISNRDSFLKQEMLWIMDRSFQVVTTKQKQGSPEQTTITRVIWNKDPYE